MVAIPESSDIYLAACGCLCILFAIFALSRTAGILAVGLVCLVIAMALTRKEKHRQKNGGKKNETEST